MLENLLHISKLHAVHDELLYLFTYMYHNMQVFS